MKAKITEVLGAKGLGTGLLVLFILLCFLDSLLPSTVSSVSLLVLSSLLFLNLVFCTIRFIRKPSLLQRWLGILLHLDLALLILLLMLNTLLRFEGYLILTEGQTLNLAEANFRGLKRGLLYTHRLAGQTLHLDTLGEAEKNGVQEYYSLLRFEHPHDINTGTGLVEARVNAPYTFHGYTLHHINYGFSPHILLRSQERELLNAFINLSIQKNQGEVRHIDRVNTADGNFLELEILPKKAHSSSELVVKVWEKDGLARLARTIHLGQKLSRGPCSLEFSALRRYAILLLTQEPAIVPIGISVIVGLVLLFLLLALRFKNHGSS